MATESDLDKIAESYIEDLINAKQDLMVEEDGTRGLFTPSRKPVSLPQSDEDADRRKKFLDGNREIYEYTLDKIPDVPLLKFIPKKEEFTAGYLVKRGLTFVADLFSNSQMIKLKGILDPFNRLKSYEELFQTLPEPSSFKTWASDESFAEQRLSGPNPLRITKLKTWSEMPFFKDAMDKVIPNSNLTYGAALDQGKLYVSDYRDLSFIKGVPNEKYVPTPVALFHYNTSCEDAVLRQLMGYPGFGMMLPVAIMVNENFPPFILGEADEDEWMIAKWCVQVADGNDHELRAHWALTHMVMEPFAVSTARQLAENHPLGLLLRPHFRFMVHNNNEAVVTLLGKGGWIEQLMGGTLEESIGIAVRAYHRWDLVSAAFPKEIASRGMEDKTTTPHYPYRDDGMMLWAAINKYVKGYLRLYYKKRQDITEDAELQAWAAELADPRGGKMQGMPGKIETLEKLIEIVTTILFTCGPQHSAVNYSQYDYMSNSLNMPLGAYCPFPVKGKLEDPLGFQMKFLPPSARAMLQQKVAVLLSSFKFDKLGFYNGSDFDDKAAGEVIKEFQKDLESIENKISVMNLERQFPYKFMKPSEITNSISV